jgi:L,D-transpeptidase ErfK/SrfK
MKPKLILVSLFVLLIWALLWIMNAISSPSNKGIVTEEIVPQANVIPTFPKWIRLKDTIRIKDYFKHIDSLVTAYDSLTDYPLTEHLLVRANPWIIDTLANTDYYHMMERDSFVYDQKQMIVLKPSDSLIVPDAFMASQIIHRINNTMIDVNIPEFKLRIYEDSSLLYTIPVRVGQNRQRYLKMGDRITDLRTKIGKGTIVDHRRDPAFYNPVDGKRFYLTKRDDQRTTLMPQIPWIETEINGIKYGQLIHPTTNPKSLGKAYSNGCIGTRESDAWLVYYHAPIGTPIHLRYDLKVTDSDGNDVVLKDIYGSQGKEP